MVESRLCQKLINVLTRQVGAHSVVLRMEEHKNYGDLLTFTPVRVRHSLTMIIDLTFHLH